MHINRYVKATALSFLETLMNEQIVRLHEMYIKFTALGMHHAAEVVRLWIIEELSK